MDKTCKNILLAILSASVNLAGEQDPAQVAMLEQTIENGVILLVRHGYSRSIVFGPVQGLVTLANETAKILA